MKNEVKKKLYRALRIIIALIIFFLAIIIIAPWLLGDIFNPIIIGLVAFVVSYTNSEKCWSFIETGNKIESKIKRILYYLIILPFKLALSSIIPVIIFYIAGMLGVALGLIILYILFIFLIAVEIICVIIQYIQTLLALIFFKHFIKYRDE